MSEEKEIKLTGKQKKFADSYVGDALFNATKAAEMAGYQGDRKSLATIGYENLRKLEISAYIEEKLSVYAMGVNETIARLAEIARGNVNDVLDEQGFFSLQVARDNNKTHLLKKIKTKRTIKQRKTEVREDMRSFLAEDEVSDIESEVEIIYEEVEFEMYSAHEAQKDIGKIHKLFTDKVETDLNVTGINLITPKIDDGTT